MGFNTVQEIERAVGTLPPQELEELYIWFDHQPNPFDRRLQSDLEAGRIDDAIQRALNDEKSNRLPAL